MRKIVNFWISCESALSDIMTATRNKWRETLEGRNLEIRYINKAQL